MGYFAALFYQSEEFYAAIHFRKDGTIPFLRQNQSYALIRAKMTAMEDKRTAIATLVCMFLLMFWMEMVMAPYNRRPPPSPQSQSPQQMSQTSQQPALQNSGQQLSQVSPPANTAAVSPAAFT